MNFLRILCAVALFAPLLWSCQREQLNTESGANAPAIHAAISGTNCGPVREIALAEGNGNMDVNFCGDGFGQVPCGPNPGAWGTINYGKYTDTGSPDVNLNLDAVLAGGWFMTDYQVHVASTGQIITTGNVPVPNNNWTSSAVTPYRNQISIDLPLPANQYPAGCFDWAIRMHVVSLDFFGLPIPGSDRTLYAYDPAGAGSPYVIDGCYETCPVSSTSSSQGSCQGCRSRVTTTFEGCNSVSLAACKNIRRVVVVYTDCSHRVFGNLNTNTFNVASNGKTISHVFVRSGCDSQGGGNCNGNDGSGGSGSGRGNSGHGNGNNNNNNSNFKLFRFDSPCVNASCN